MFIVLRNKFIVTTHQPMDNDKVPNGSIVYEQDDKEEAECKKFGPGQSFNEPHRCVSLTKEGEVLFFVPVSDLQ